MRTIDIINEYGQPGENLGYVYLPYKMKLAWDTDVSVSKFSCHKFIIDRLENIFNDTLNFYGNNMIDELGLNLFGGCFNIRAKTGSRELSTHAWGLAVDIDPLNNRFDWKSDKAKLAKPEYRKFWEIVTKNGGISLGLERNFDWMHFQFVKL